jgi:nucleotide-binding universal stress UspA family protein
MIPTAGRAMLFIWRNQPGGADAAPPLSDFGEQPMYKNILIATDGSKLAHKAVDHGLELAKSIGAKVTAVIVEPPFNVFDVRTSHRQQISQEFEHHAQAVKQHATKVLGEVASAAQKIGLNCDTVQIEHEQPYEAIIKTAENKGCDAIVMASHGRSGISAVLLGSVTNKVLTHTVIPVLVVH